MARISKQGLSRHQTKGFRIGIGKKPDGNPRTFWLGHDRVAAEYAAQEYKNRWDLIVYRGGTCWTPEDEAKVKGDIDVFVRVVLKGFPARLEDDRQRVEREIAAERERRLEAVEEPRQRFVQTFGEPVAAPAVVAEATPGEAAPSLYGGIKAYLKSIKAKRLSDSHSLSKDLEYLLEGFLKVFSLVMYDVHNTCSQRSEILICH